MLFISQISSGKPRLLQFPTSAINRYLEKRCFRQRTLLEADEFKPDPRVIALRNKLLYCDYLDLEKVRMGHKQYKIKATELRQNENQVAMKKLSHESAYSVLLNDKMKDDDKDEQYKDTSDQDDDAEFYDSNPMDKPLARVDKYETTEVSSNTKTERKTALLNERYKVLYEKYLEAKKATTRSGEQINIEDYINKDASTKRPKGELWKVPEDWMTDFELFDDTILETDWSRNQGTPNPNSKVSSIPCGGCGALLHCKDPELPGYLPSEIFLQGDDEDLKVTTCQRCHFLKFYNAAMDVKVSIDDYPKILQPLKKKKCAIVLMVDLTDFPCSIWPDLQTILHPQTLVILVGNKVDLLPRDSRHCLPHIRNKLLETVLQVTNIDRKIIHRVVLTSAKTGYGIEELITTLQTRWGSKGDVYLIGCTNVGKSSLFNTLLNSDYCKVQAIDLVQRATISPWPGTTLNLLKFPLLRPSRQRLSLRAQRLFKEQRLKAMEEQYRTDIFRDTRNLRFATLQGKVGKTFSNRTADHVEEDSFTIGSRRKDTRKLGLDENDADFRESRWFFDTPGTMQSDQVLDLLTTDELVATLPNRIISPRTFILDKGQTMFLAGIGRLDHIQGDITWCTLFASINLPITICHTGDADDVYKELIKTEAFVVPVNNPERLKSWPALESKEFKVYGINKYKSAADVVLSSAGWIAIALNPEQCVTLNAWTPQGRGIYLRSPAILTKSVALRGNRVQNTPIYRLGQQVYVE